MNIKTVKWVFWLLIACLIFQKLSVLFQFSFIYTDNDQLILWNILRDYGRGIFHEPFFYGQDYNFPLEAWGALPAYWLGMPPHIALPIVTVCFSITPFIIIIALLYRKQQYIPAILIIFYLCCMSEQYDLITAIPRGFVQGIFISSLALLLIKKPGLVKFFVIGFLLAFAFSANPNSFFLTLFILFICIKNIENILKIKPVAFLVAGAIIAWLVHLECNQFYTLHPNHNLHAKAPMAFAFADLSRLSDLDAQWDGLTPIIWDQAIFNCLLLTGFFVYFMINKNYAFATWWMIMMVLILASIGFAKTADGRLSFLFPYSRLYLSLPVVFCLFIFLTAETGKKIMTGRMPLIFLILFALGLTIYKSVHIMTHVNKELKIDAGIQCSKVNDLKEKCALLKKKMVATNTYLTIMTDRNDKIAYGCPCIWNNDSFETFSPEYERRAWQLEREDSIVRPRFLIYFWDDYHVTRIDSTCIPLNHHIFLIKNPGIPATQWLKNKQYAIRPFQSINKY